MKIALLRRNNQYLGWVPNEPALVQKHEKELTLPGGFLSGTCFSNPHELEGAERGKPIFLVRSVWHIQGAKESIYTTEGVFLSSPDLSSIGNEDSFRNRIKAEYETWEKVFQELECQELRCLE